VKKNTYVAIVGLPGSGKSVAAQFFRLQGFSVLRFGDVTDIGLGELGLPLTEANERKYREEIRAKLGMGAMAIKIEPRIREAEKTSSLIALDGMRSFEEYVYLKEKFPGLIVLCIYAAPATRYQRLATRKERPLSVAESQSRDYAEIENLHSGGPIAMADYLIQNESTPEAFEASLKNFLNTLP
jgi:dephospho-CoA kinase